MKKILFISYCFKPDKSVAAQRMSYWAENIKRYLTDIEVDVITTSGSSVKDAFGVNNIFVVPDHGKGFLAKIFKSDRGASWFSNLKSYFSVNRKQYDVVIISGNPFLHFFIAASLKKIMKCKIILDYRDPFSKNERNLQDSFSLSLMLKRKLLVILEYVFSEFADKIIVMNTYCAELLCSRRKSIVEIIDNGYDEINLDRAHPISAFKNDKKQSLIYLGSFAKDRNLVNLLTVNDLLDSKFNVLHVGRPSTELAGDNRVKSVGLVPYCEAIGYAKGSSIGLILASGKKFESTTKIFDYIGINLPILIITNGKVKMGNVYELVKDYPQIWWAENNIESLTKALTDISLSEGNNGGCEFNSVTFSRDEGLKKLVRVITSLE